MSVLPMGAAAALLVAYLPLAGALSVIDLREHRLPNRLVLALTAAVALVLGTTALLVPGARGIVALAAILGGATAVVGIAIALLTPHLLGMGDAKTAPAVVATATALGWDVLAGGLLGTALLGGIAGIVTLARTGDARARFAYGPVLLAAPLLGLLLAPLVRGALGV